MTDTRVIVYRIITTPKGSRFLRFLEKSEPMDRSAAEIRRTQLERRLGPEFRVRLVSIPQSDPDPKDA